jgi:hypothetical protein
VRALTVYNGELIAGGGFTTAGGVSAIKIARWNGTNWQPLGTGMNDYVRALTVYNGELIAGGNFTTAGGVSANYIAHWNGTSWQPLGTGMNYSVVSVLTVYDGELIAGGSFTTAGGNASAYWARWGCAAPAACPGDMNCDGRVNFADIDPFVAALSGQSAWTHWPCPWLNADCNGDTYVTFADIDPFVAVIGTTCP